jgi:glycosyltransferase involved in cell wall biosynthesis
LKILIITEHLNYTNGVAKHLLYFLQAANKKSEHQFTVICGGGDATDLFKPFVQQVLIWPYIKHANRSILNLLKSVIKLFLIQKASKFDIIHTHNHFAANIAVYVSLLIKVKVIQTIHGLLEPVGRLRHYPAKNIIAVNEHIIKNLEEEKNIRVNNIVLIRSGLPKFYGINKPDNVNLKVIAAGRFTGIKAFDVYLNAIALLNPDIKNKVDFYLVGSGDKSEELKNFIKKLAINVFLLNEQTHLIELLETTNILVNPSRSRYEGFPMTIVEAAFTKNLIISSDFLGYDSILKDGINSLIFTVNDSKELADKITYAINNFKEIQPFIDKLHKQVINDFNVETMVNKTFDFYKDILS